MWSEEDLQYFLERLMDETAAGNIHWKWRNLDVFEKITSELVERTGKLYTLELVDKQYHRLHSRYWVWDQALKSKRVKWDRVQNKLLVPNEAIWDILVKVVYLYLNIFL
ncbi:hypothetical protein ACJIZ3_011334 [Penstemon smallii]|uniref:Myb/SANT-like domain-containing protein n=1 Tax=Penstemon smallii TaxID=265156 RepID=A0ABD3UJ13_9LAMI